MPCGRILCFWWTCCAVGPSSSQWCGEYPQEGRLCALQEACLSNPAAGPAIPKLGITRGICAKHTAFWVPDHLNHLRTLAFVSCQVPQGVLMELVWHPGWFVAQAIESMEKSA